MVSCFFLWGCGRPAAPPAPPALASPAAAPADADARFAAGEKRLEAGDPRGALSDLVYAAEFAAGRPGRRFALGVAYFRLDEHARARAAFEAELANGPHAGALEYLARIAYAEGRLAEAKARLEETLKLDPELAGAKQLLARIEKEAPVEAGLEERASQHFVLRFEGGVRGDAGLADLVLAALESAYADVGYRLGVYPSRPIPVLLYPERDFYAVTGAHGWVGALFDGKIRVPAKGLGAGTDARALAQLLRHEYTHACVCSIAPRCPVWLHEGLAQELEGGRAAPEPAVRAALGHGEVPALDDLPARFTAESDGARVRILYATAHAFVRWLLSRGGGAATLGGAIARMGEGASASDALERAYGQPLSALDADWRASLAP